MKFDTLKTIQAAAIVLKQHNSRCSRLRLLKILYIAERQVLAQTLRPILGDRVVAMDHGPVHSRTYDLLKGEDTESVLWGQFIANDGPRDLRLTGDPGVGRLSRFEIDQLVAVCQKYFFEDDYRLADATHEFPEWQKNRPAPKGSRPIPLDDILAAMQLGDQSSRVHQEAAADEELDRLFTALPQ